MRPTVWVCGGLLLALAAQSGACAPGPRQRPVRMGDVDTGSGSLEAARRELQGSWALGSLELVEATGARQPVKARGVLSYDAFGNLRITGTIDDSRLEKAIPLQFTGRIVIDPAKRVFYPADVEGPKPADPKQLAPVGLDKVRQYEVSGDKLVITYLDASGKPTAVTTWKKTGPA